MLYFLAQIFQESATGHIHVEPCRKRLEGGILSITSETVRDQAMNGICIADHEAVVAPGIAQHIVQQPTVSGRGNIIEIHVRAHEAANMGVGCCLERR